ncbi:hypothetical protein AURDEDRAFT_113107, partial [Auricularia subglabra TFB-10046 SS5]
MSVDNALIHPEHDDLMDQHVPMRCNDRADHVRKPFNLCRRRSRVPSPALSVLVVLIYVSTPWTARCVSRPRLLPHSHHRPALAL